MADLLDDLGINKEDYSEIQEQTAGGSVIEPGVYKMETTEVFVRNTDKGAKMLHIVAFDKSNPKTVIEYSTCIQSGDEKGNKSTYKDKNTGAEKQLPGVIELKHFQQAIKLDSLATEVTKTTYNNSEITVKSIPGAVGKSLALGIKTEDDGEYQKNIITAFMTVEGENNKGERIVEKVAENIARNPIKKPKGGKKETAAAKAPEKVKGWS